MFRNGERMGTIKFNQFQGTLLFIKLTTFGHVVPYRSVALAALFFIFLLKLS